jgi:hypothetical protein
MSFELWWDAEAPEDEASFFDAPFLTIPMSLTRAEFASFPVFVLVGNPFYYIFAGLRSLINDL